MLRSDLITTLMERRRLSEAQANALVETIFGSMVKSLCASEHIELRGFGSFHVKSYAAYEGRNPRTGAKIPVRPKRSVVYRMSKEMLARLNRNAEEPPATSSAEPTPG